MHEISIFLNKTIKSNEIGYGDIIINNLNDCVIITDIDKNILYFNRSYSSATGYSLEELKGKSYLELVNNNYKKIEGISNDSSASNIYESTHINKNGARLQFMTNCIKIEKEKGYIFILKDLTSYKAREEEFRQNEIKIKQFAKLLADAHDELLQAKIAAEAANKAKSIFLANMSHEIRSPMSSIIGFAEIISSDELPVEEVQEMSGYILKSGKDLLKLINEILDLSKIEAGKILIEKRNFNLKDKLFECFKIIEFKAKEKNLSLRFEYNPDLPETITTDEIRLGQVINNLLTNAVKFTDSGHIILKCDLFEDENSILFSVSDTGIGIPKDKHKSIFEPFVQAEISTTRKYGGTGLGLTITEKLVEIMGGKIWFESEEGYGTTFNFTIPLKSIPYFPSVIKEKNKDTLKGRTTQEVLLSKNNIKRKILIVEDNMETSLFFKKILSEADYQVIHAENGKDSLEMFKKETFTLILMDIDMPVMNGLETTKIIRSLPEGKNIPIIACTGRDIEEHIEDFMEAGFDDYISKPVNKKELLNITKKFTA